MWPLLRLLTKMQQLINKLLRTLSIILLLFYYHLFIASNHSSVQLYWAWTTCCGNFVRHIILNKMFLQNYQTKLSDFFPPKISSHPKAVVKFTSTIVWRLIIYLQILWLHTTYRVFIRHQRSENSPPTTQNSPAKFRWQYVAIFALS